MINSILKICRLESLFGFVVRCPLHRESWHADATRHSALPRERFRSVAQGRRFLPGPNGSANWDTPAIKARPRMRTLGESHGD